MGYFMTSRKPDSKAEKELRRLREWVERARAQAIRVETPDGVKWLLPDWFMVMTPLDNANNAL